MKRPVKPKKPSKPASKPVSQHFTKAQTAEYNWLKAHFPFKNDLKAWEKAHPFPNDLKAWEAAHPFPPSPAPAAPGFNPGGVMKTPGSSGSKKPKPAPSKPPAPKPAAAAGAVAESPWLRGMNDSHRTCVATAIANSLMAATGIVLSDRDILGFGEDITVENALHYAISLGLELEAMWCEGAPAVLEPGYLLLLDHAAGVHTVLYAGDDEMVSWGGLEPLSGRVEQTWKLSWEGGRNWQAAEVS